MFDPESIRTQIVQRLPMRARWIICGTPLDFDFSRSRFPLRPIAPMDVNGRIHEEWRVLYLFGESRYADGGGACPFLGVHRDSGGIFGLDLEREQSQVFLLNSGIERFVRSFHLVDELLSSGSITSERLSTLMRFTTVIGGIFPKPSRAPSQAKVLPRPGKGRL